jgi:hypothetical protein
LLVAAGLFLRTYTNLVFLDIGFDRSNLLLANLDLSHATDSPEVREGLLQEIQRRVEGIPGAISASRSVLTPLGRMSWNDYLYLDGSQAPKGDDDLVYFNAVTPGYFSTLRTPLLAGRDFNTVDTATSPRVAIVNETTAHKFFRGESPLGQCFKVEESPGKLSPPIEIVGVVKDSKYQSLREDFLPSAYYPVSQLGDTLSDAVLEIRTGARPDLFLPAVRDAVSRVNPAIVVEFGTLKQQIDDSLS